MFESDQAAAEALAAANSGAEVNTPDPQEVEQAPVATPDMNDAGATPEDSFTSIDPNTLPEELRGFHRQLQGDYTRKTQEIAEYRKLGVSPDEAQQALQIMQSLQDPDFQRELYTRLDSQFGEQDGEFGLDEDFGANDPQAAVITDLQSRLDRFERQQMEVQISAELDRAEAAIRTSNPNYSDDDIESIAQLALSQDGDMLRAAEAYKSLEQRIVSAHLNRKAQVPAGASAPGASGNAEVPTKFADLDEAHKAAMKAWEIAMANGG